MNGFKRNDFTQIKKSGQKNFINPFCIFFLESNDKKIAVSISKKIGKANKRNKIRRQIKEIYRQLNFSGLCWCIMQKKSEDLSFLSLIGIFNKLSALCKKNHNKYIEL